jgi:hypothetical protein
MERIWILVRGCQGLGMCNVVRFGLETSGLICVYVAGSWAACIPCFVYFSTILWFFPSICDV